jgi:hypothetical protein
MSVAFAVEVARSANEARWRAVSSAIPAAGLALSAVHLSSGRTPLSDASFALAVALALACGVGAIGLALAALLAWRGSRCSVRSTDVPPAAEPCAPSVTAGTPRSLIVDEAGLAALQDGPGAPPRPMALRAWCMLPGLTVLVLAPYPPQASVARRGSPVTLMLGRDASSDEAWRRLHVWLRWNARGHTHRQT